MPAVIIGVEPHERSNTVTVLDRRAQVIATERFVNDHAGHQALKEFAPT